MSFRAAGALALADAVVSADLSEAAARARGWSPTAVSGVLVREVEDPRGRALLVALRFVGGRLLGFELRYAVRRPAEDANGNLDWEDARKDFHDAICREWLASSVHDLMYAPPPQPGPLAFRLPWGAVRSVRHEGDRGAIIEVTYDAEAH